MLPPAPVVLSMTSGWPRLFRMRSPMIRASVSVGPPAENGTTIVIGREGYGCADAMELTAIVANASTTNSVFMGLLLLFAIQDLDLHVTSRARGLWIQYSAAKPHRVSRDAPRLGRVMYAEPFSPPEFHACSSICSRVSAARRASAPALAVPRIRDCKYLNMRETRAD